MLFKCYLIGAAAVILWLVTCTPFDLSSAAGEQNITVILDNESYRLMESIGITWASDFEILSVDIELWKDNRALEVLAEEVEADSFSTWSVHSSLESGEDYTIRIISSTDPTLYGESEPFTIDITYRIQVSLDSSRYVMFEYPSVEWSADILIDQVRLELWSKGELIETLSDMNSTGDLAGWQVHQGIAYGTEYTVRAVSLDDETIIGESDQFTILTYLVLGGNGYDHAGDIEIDSAGNVYLCGSSNSSNISGTNPSGAFDCLLFKLTTNGQYESDFDSAGKKMFSAPVSYFWEGGAPSITIDSSRNLYCSGTDTQSGFEFTAARLFADGALDAGFGTDGQCLIYGEEHDVCDDIVLDIDGSSCFLIGRSMSNENDYLGEPLYGVSDACIIKINSNGSLDTTFHTAGADGIVMIGGTGGDTFYTGDIDPDDGSVFAAGSSTSATLPGYNGGTDFFIAKIDDSTGVLDSGFGTSGMTVVGGSGDESCLDIFFAKENSDKKLYLAGASDSSGIYGDQTGDGSNEDFLSAKLDASNGTLDVSFSDDGLFRFGGNGDDRSIGVCTYNNKIYLAGWSESTDITGEVEKGGRDILVLRLNMDGTIDTSFHGNGILTLGGDSEDTLVRTVVGPGGNLYLIATTASTNIPGQPINGFYDFLLIAMKP